MTKIIYTILKVIKIFIALTAAIRERILTRSRVRQQVRPIIKDDIDINKD